MKIVPHVLVLLLLQLNRAFSVPGGQGAGKKAFVTHWSASIAFLLRCAVLQLSFCLVFLHST